MNATTDKVHRYAAGGVDIGRWFNPFAIFMQLWSHRLLIRQFTFREVAGRYRGSYLGLLWAFLNPFFMLLVYTFVFAIVFGAKWGFPQETKADFAVILFAGLIAFNIFSEVINAAPSLVLSNPMFVKKVVFPLEILVVAKLLSAIINAIFSALILLAAVLAAHHSLPWTIILLPLVWLPLGFFTLGLAYFFASLGVFVRDIGHVMGIAVSIIFFLSPVFFSQKTLLEKLPDNLHLFFKINPLAVFLEDTRKVLIFGVCPDWRLTLLMLGFSFLVFVLGFAWFMKSKRAFADVI